MKKAISIILVICLALSVIACKGRPDALTELPEETLTTPEPQEIPTPTPELEESSDIDENIVEALLTRPVMNPEKGDLYGYGHDGYAELQYEVRYLFEQIALPMTALSIDEVLIELIDNDDSESVEELISTVWENALMVVVAEDFESRSEIGGDVETDEDQVLDYIENMRVLCNLESDENIINIKIEVIDENTTGVFLTLINTGWSHLSTYIAIVYSQTEELAYYTLEKSYTEDDDIIYYFCYVDMNTRGTLFSIENTQEAFIEAILTENKETGTQ